MADSSEASSMQSQKVNSDDDVPLSSRRTAVALAKKSALSNGKLACKADPGVKRTSAERKILSDDDESDDIPLAKRKKTNNLKAKGVKAKKGPKMSRTERVAAMSDCSSDDVPLRSSKKKAKKESSSSESSEPLSKKVSKKKAAKKAKKESSDSSDDIPISKRKPAKKKSSKKAASKKGAKAGKKKTPPPEEPVREWWNEEPLPKGKKWRTLTHNGLCFPPEYAPHGIPVVYDGREVELTPEQEEPATWYATILESDYAKKSTFNKNFFHDWKKLLGKGHVIKEFKKCDFRRIHAYLQTQKDIKKNRSKEERDREKELKAEQKAKFGYVMQDGYKEEIANCMVEPPGLFRGRGDHPLMGKFKKRIYPKDVHLNLSKGAPIPPTPPPYEGHKWAEIHHNDEVQWMAYWKDNVQGRCKYVKLGAGSATQGRSDYKKFEKARALHKIVDKIRDDYMKDLTSSDSAVRQKAVAVWMIDQLSLRCGHEKGKDEADTVGVCNLRVEHVEPVKVEDDTYALDFDFLGKDSMRYERRCPCPKDVYKAVKSFKEGKPGGKELFDKLKAHDLNNWLKSIMPGLTAKVFRTYNASRTLEELLFATSKPGASKPAMEATFNRANKECAILCNHKKTKSKNFDVMLQRAEDRIRELEKKRKEVKKSLKSEDDKTKKKKIKAQMEKLEEKIAKARNDMDIKVDNAEVALGTSKVNYLDPRISTAWCKTYDVDLKVAFSKALLKKFPWALVVSKDWRFVNPDADEIRFALGDDSEDSDADSSDSSDGSDAPKRSSKKKGKK